MIQIPINPKFLDRGTKTFGPCFKVPEDGVRLGLQHETIRDIMLSAIEWLTLKEIEYQTGYPQASISAQLRHLRKKKFGGWRVEKRRRDGCVTWEYRMTGERECQTTDDSSLT